MRDIGVTGSTSPRKAPTGLTGFRTSAAKDSFHSGMRHAAMFLMTEEWAGGGNHHDQYWRPNEARVVSPHERQWPRLPLDYAIR